MIQQVIKMVREFKLRSLLPIQNVLIFFKNKNSFEMFVR